MKFRISALLIILLAANIQSRAQYKDLEGVFFGKVIAIGVGGSIISYKEKEMGTNMSITPINYSVLINDKFIWYMKFAIHNQNDVVYAADNGIQTYTMTHKTKFREYELGIKMAITKGGLEKPTSVFLNFQGGLLFGKREFIDSRDGYTYDDISGLKFLGAGLSVMQRLGERFIVFAEPAYRFMLSSRNQTVYLGNGNDKKLDFSHLNGHLGIMFLIGKKG